MKNVVYAASAVLLLGGCVSGGGTATDMVTATTAIRGVTQATEPPSTEDYELSCGDVSDRLSNLYGRYEELEREQRARQRRASLVEGAVGMGVGVLGGSALANAGSATAVRNVGLATNYGGGALSSLARQESSTQQLKEVNDAMLIAQRAAQLERVKFDKGC